MTPFFRNFYEYFKTTRAWSDMAGTVEGTGWHREENVAVHTEMTIDYYEENFAPIRSERAQDLAMLALLFHDIGKPSTEIQTEKDGVVRNQYLGHEERSATHMLFLFRHEEELRTLLFQGGYNWSDVMAIAFIVGRHLPYGLKKREKVNKLKREIQFYLGEDEEVFFDVLRSDSNGRISDTHEENLAAVEDWITNFRK